VKECQEATEPDSIDFSMCINPTDPKTSYGGWCNDDYLEPEEEFNKNYCMRDMCTLCC